MSRAKWLGWVLVAVWAVWLATAQGYAATHTPYGAWMPDLSLVLALSLAAHVASEDLPKLALVHALAVASVSIQPPAAILAASLATIALARGLRSVFEIASATPRTLLAGIGELLVGGWFELVHRLGDARDAAQHASAASSRLSAFELLAASWRSALATALAALVLGPALAHLPGLTRLWKQSPWRAAVSLR